MLKVKSNVNYRVGYDTQSQTWSVRFLSYGVVERIVWEINGEPTREAIYDPPMEVVPNDTILVIKEDMTPCL